ncbi:putative aminopeptidase, partial [Zancudomyces culisetae]
NYKSPDQSQVKEHVYLVGKGVTFDTGGINVKSGEGMRGMSRDKLGACTVAGFVLAAASMQSTKANITAILSWERNSVGPDSLLPDEVLVSRAGVRVTVVNTDAEGRMVMTDPLAEVKERIVDARKKGDNTPAVVYTVATLTGHVIIAYGGYGATVANGPARNNRLDKHLSEAGMKYGENFENSVLRRDDYSLIASCSEVEDIYQSNTRPSSVTPRGHVYPAAIMIRASGLDKHDSSAKPEDRISYMHLDIAGNAEELGSSGLALPKITGAPIAAFVGAHLV